MQNKKKRKAGKSEKIKKGMRREGGRKIIRRRGRELEKVEKMRK